MNTKSENKRFADFSMPAQPYGPVIVSRIGAGGSASPIGRIYQDFGNEEGIITYLAFDSEGEELFSPTEDWSEMENQFEKYAKNYSQRREEIKKIRLSKNQQEQTINR